MVALEPLGITDLIPSKGASDLLGKSLVVAELGEDGLVKEVLNIFCVVESSGLGRVFGGLFLVAGLTGVYA